MLSILLVLLIALWLLGYVNITGLTVPTFVLFTINDNPITLRNLLIFLVVGWIVGNLPTPFREVASILLILYLLTTIGVIAIAGLANILVAVIIIGLIFYLLRGI